MASKKENVQVTEKLGFGMMLALMGGFMDVYSYTLRGNVFATGQTGNLVLVAVDFAEKDYMGMLHAAVPIVSFWLGIFIAWHMFYSQCKEKPLLWKRWILVAEIFILFITGLIPCSYPDIIANSLVSFAASIQYCAFRKFGEDQNYASVFCTGNMRSCAENYYKGILRKDKQSLKKALRYSYILISFAAGAAVGALEARILHEKAIWTVDVVILGALLLSFVLNTDTLTTKNLKANV